MKKKTHEEYIEELAIKNPNVKVVEQYIDAKTPILHYCVIHDVYWKTISGRVLAGHGCKECKKDKFIQARIKSHQEYVKEIEDINPNIIVVEQYNGANTPILHKCKIDNCEWYPTPSNILKGCGCPKCRDKLLHDQKIKTQEQYKEDVNKIYSTINVIGEYVGAETPILHKCLIDGYEWLARPSNILSGKGCPKCAGNLQLTHEEYVNRLFDINPNIKPIGKYINAKTKIWHQCLIDGYLWEVEPSSTLQGFGCPKCVGNIHKTHNEYVEELSIINPDIEVVDQYIDAKTPIIHRCKLDGYEWKIAPSNILNQQGCPICQESTGERLVRQWLDAHNILYKYQYRFDDCKDKNTLPFDFYLLGYNICIEYQGKQHYEPVDFAGKGKEWADKQFVIVQNHDNIKLEYCKNKNIRLLHIPYFKDVNEILNDYLLNIVT